jgi:hypothetical protein
MRDLYETCFGDLYETCMRDLYETCFGDLVRDLLWRLALGTL